MQCNVVAMSRFAGLDEDVNENFIPLCGKKSVAFKVSHQRQGNHTNRDNGAVALNLNFAQLRREFASQ